LVTPTTGACVLGDVEEILAQAHQTRQHDVMIELSNTHHQFVSPSNANGIQANAQHQPTKERNIIKVVRDLHSLLLQPDWYLADFLQTKQISYRFQVFTPQMCPTSIAFIAVKIEHIVADSILRCFIRF
jgi:hypothetical protein